MRNQFLPENVVIALRNCIIHYLSRRRETVIQIMIERRAPLLRSMGVERILHVDLEPYCQAFYADEEGAYLQQSGIWRGEWKYYFHGHGCRLTHLRTQEPFDWDASNPRYFMTGELTGHLLWRIHSEVSDPNVIILTRYGWKEAWHSQDIAKALEYLEAEGIVSRVRDDYHEKWRLLK
jgi:hypothetical protein